MYPIHQNIMNKVAPNMFMDIDHYTRFQRILTFQKFVSTASPLDIYNEFVRLSRTVFESDFDIEFNNLDTLYDYQNLILLEYDMFGIHESEFYTGMNISNFRVIIPCHYDLSHNGVNCLLVDHLNGIGCPDCAQMFGISGFFPKE